MTELYPPSPRALPASFARPSAAYRRASWASLAALVLFGLLYVGLLLALGHRVLLFAALTLERGTRDALETGAIALLLAALFALIVRRLFFVERAVPDVAIELTAEMEPALFSFLHRLADEAGALRPQRLLLTPGVDASVAWDLSLRDLFAPSKKSLRLGVGLVNVLTLDECKAVLAHELGHFAQRSMAIGRWVYVAQQAVFALVHRRDALDDLLATLSWSDPRFAWPIWFVRLGLWAVRALVETLFLGVLALERGLSRQMELQADRLSVALCGSDSLVHALARLPAADEALERAVAYAREEAGRGRPIADLYAAQQDFLARLREVRGLPSYGRVPAIPLVAPELHRVIDRAAGAPPRMWSTHPPSWLREEEAKRPYVASTLDERSAWQLFRAPDETRRRMTRQLEELRPTGAVGAPLEPQECTERIGRLFARRALSPALRGACVGRSLVRGLGSVEEAFGPLPADPVAAIDALYPPSLATVLERWRATREQLGQLADDRRGRTGRAPGALREALQAHEALGAELSAHDRAARAAHQAAARRLGGGWAERHRGLVAALHYFEHARADVDDAAGALRAAWADVSRGGTLSERALRGLLAACAELHGALTRLQTDGPAISLDEEVARALGVADWAAALGPFELPAPARDALGAGWIGPALERSVAARDALAAAAAETLEALLGVEAALARDVRAGAQAGPAPAPAKVPTDYPLARPGDGRPRQRGGDAWQRFLTADGWLAGSARLTAAAAVLAPVALLSAASGSTDVVVHNGLLTRIEVDVGAQHGSLAPGESRRLSLTPDAKLRLRATTSAGVEIERLEVDASRPRKSYVWNVAGADVLYEERLSYDAPGRDEPQRLGTPRFFAATSELVFEGPPPTAPGREPVSRTSLTGRFGTRPAQIGELFDSKAERLAFATLHARFASTRRDGFDDWLLLLERLGGEPIAIVRERLGGEPDDVLLRRALQDYAPHEACREAEERARAAPDDGDRAFLVVRCASAASLPEALARATARFPANPWLALIAANLDLQAGRWAEATAKLDVAAPQLPSLASVLGWRRLRARRAAGEPLARQLGLVPSSPRAPWERALLAAEAGEPAKAARFEDDWTTAEVALARGELDAAFAAARRVGPGNEPLLWRIAASSGARPAHRAAVLEAPRPDGLDDPGLLLALAFVIANGADGRALQAELDRRAPEFAAWSAPALRAKDPATRADELEQLVVRRDPYDRGLARTMGVILLGPAAPAPWRTEARALLLPWERPFVE